VMDGFGQHVFVAVMTAPGLMAVLEGHNPGHFEGLRDTFRSA